MILCFKEFMIEATRFTQSASVLNANLGSGVYSVKHVIDTAYNIISSGNYKDHEPHERGDVYATPIIACDMAASYKGKYEKVPVRITVANPKYFVRNPYGAVVTAKPQIIIWWDAAEKWGLDYKGKLFDPNMLYTTISHEIVHKLDKFLQIKDKKIIASDPFYNSDDGKAWAKSNWISNSSKSNYEASRTDKKKKKYVNASFEILARRDSFAYELAKRIAATGSAERATPGAQYPSYKVSSNVNWNTMKQELFRITPLTMSKYMTVPESYLAWYQENPKEFKRILSNAYRYLQDIIHKI